MDTRCHKYSADFILQFQIRIDSQQGHVVMGTETTSPYQQLIEKTKALSHRSQMQQLNVEKKKKSTNKINPTGELTDSKFTNSPNFSLHQCVNSLIHKNFVYISAYQKFFVDE